MPNPKKVPGTDQNIYLNALISPEYIERYPQLINIFRRAVDDHKILEHYISKINYDASYFKF
jgi:hypothetical protein